MVKVFFFIFNGLAQQCRENNHSGTKLWAVIYPKNVANICLKIWYRMFDKMFNVCYTSLHHSVIAGVHFFGEMKDLITYLQFRNNTLSNRITMLKLNLISTKQWMPLKINGWFINSICISITHWNYLDLGGFTILPSSIFYFLILILSVLCTFPFY